MRILPLVLLAIGCASNVPSTSCVTNADCESNSCVNGRCVLADDAGAGRDADLDVTLGRPDVPRPDVAAEPDAAVMDVRAPDAPDDVGVDAPFTSCAPAIFCDDFETPPPMGRYDATVSGASVIELSGTQAHSGTQSILIRATQSDPSVSIGFSAFDDSEVGDRWVRAWYYLPNLAGLTPLALESPTSALTVFTGGPGYTALDTYMFPGEQQSYVSTLPLRNQVWTCIEVHLDYDGGTGAELYIDGALAAQMTRELPRALQFVRLGASFRDPDDPAVYDVYIDDIAVSLERVGCGDL